MNPSNRPHQLCSYTYCNIPTFFWDLFVLGVCNNMHVDEGIPFTLVHFHFLSCFMTHISTFPETPCILKPLGYHKNTHRHPTQLEPKKTRTGKKTRTRFLDLLMSPPKITNHIEQPPKMAETLPHDGFWPILGQKSCHEKNDQTKIGGRTPCPIWTNGVVQLNGLIARGRPYRTGCVIFPSHHHQHGY